MSETQWWVYGQCRTCFALAQEECKGMKGTGVLTRPHRGRAKLPLSITEEQAEEIKAAVRNLGHADPEAT